MKRIVLCLVLVLGAGLAYADSQNCKCKHDAKVPTDNGKTEVVTGSQIPVKVDKKGRPLKSTLKVTVVDEPTIRTFGLGEPSSALRRLPYTYWRAGRR